VKNYLSPQIRKDVHATFDKEIPFSWFNNPAVVVFGSWTSVCGRPNSLRASLCSLTSPQLLFFLRQGNTGSRIFRAFFFLWQITMFISRKQDKKRSGADTLPSNPSTPPLCHQHQYSFLLTYTLPSRVEREMSIDMVNDVLNVMTVDPTDDGLSSLMDNTVSSRTRTVLFTVKDG